jgi:Arc/MetJ-type ribon-helix-helix transcriptional regulator
MPEKKKENTKKKKKQSKPYITKTIPFSRVDVRIIDHLVNQGVFTSFSDCVRTAVREWIYGRIMETSIKDELLSLRGDMIFDRDTIKTMLSDHIARVLKTRNKKD